MSGREARDPGARNQRPAFAQPRFRKVKQSVDVIAASLREARLDQSKSGLRREDAVAQLVDHVGRAEQVGLPAQLAQVAGEGRRAGQLCRIENSHHRFAIIKVVSIYTSDLPLWFH